MTASTLPMRAEPCHPRRSDHRHADGENEKEGADEFNKVFFMRVGSCGADLSADFLGSRGRKPRLIINAGVRVCFRWANLCLTPSLAQAKLQDHFLDDRCLEENRAQGNPNDIRCRLLRREDRRARTERFGQSSLMRILAGIDQELTVASIRAGLPGGLFAAGAGPHRRRDGARVRRGGVKHLTDLTAAYDATWDELSAAEDDKAKDAISQASGELQEKIDHLGAWTLPPGGAGDGCAPLPTR